MADRDERDLGEDLERKLDDVAETVQRPHDDAEERKRAQEGAERAEHQPRRQGEGIHPGSH